MQNARNMLFICPVQVIECRRFCATHMNGTHISLCITSAAASSQMDSVEQIPYWFRRKQVDDYQQHLKEEWRRWQDHLENQQRRLMPFLLHLLQLFQLLRLLRFLQLSRLQLCRAPRRSVVEGPRRTYRLAQFGRRPRPSTSEGRCRHHLTRMFAM